MMNEKGLSRTLVDAIEVAENLAHMLEVAVQEYTRPGSVPNKFSWTARADSIRTKLGILRSDANQLYGEIM